MFSEILALNNVVALLSLILFISYLLAIFRVKSRTNVFMVLFICSLLNIILFTFIISNHKHLKEMILIVILNILALLFLLYFMTNKGTMLEPQQKRSVTFYNISISLFSLFFLISFVFQINGFLTKDYSMKTREMIESTTIVSKKVQVNEANLYKLKRIGVIDRDSHLMSEKDKDIFMGAKNGDEKSKNLKGPDIGGVDLVESLILNRISEAVIFFAGLMALVSLFSARTKQVPTSFRWIYKIKGYLGFRRTKSEG